MAIKLVSSVLCNACLAVLLHIFDKKTAFGKTKYALKQLIIGLIFGAIAVFSSTSMGGVDIGGAIMNVRDSSPLCAGLIFGAPAGIIAGFVGGIYRYVAVFFRLAGEYTQIACSVSTVIAGFIAALLRKFMFENKKPTWLYGVGLAMICEVLHMLMIFFTNMNDVSTAFRYVQKCTVPMVVGNGVAVGLAIIGVSLFSYENKKQKKLKKPISQTFSLWLLVCIIIAFISTSIFTSFLQTEMSESQTEEVIRTNLSDVYKDISDASDENLLIKTDKIRQEYLAGEDVNVLAQKYNVIEVNIIGENGKIIKTNNTPYLGYDMASGEQSAEFLVLLNSDKTEYVQDYRPTSYDNKTYRKYGALKLSDGGFLQVGYDASQFRADIDEFVGKVAKNRHVGKNGFITICDENFDIVTENSKNSGKNLSEIGIDLELEKTSDGNIFEIEINGKQHLCAYEFVEGYYIIGAMPSSEAMHMKNVSVYVSIFMEIIIFAVLFLLIYILIKKIIIDNIKRINHSLSEITDGNLNVTVDVRSNEEFASLSDDINSTVNTLKNYIAEAAARIDKELEFAKQIQYSSLPSGFPERNEFELYAMMDTAKEVGGDFYDFYMLDKSHVAFLVADVSGKGIPAAMFMMKAKTIIKDLAENGLEPDEIFTSANEKLCENNDAGMFVTAWLGILSLETGNLRFANAGHNPPLIKIGNGDFEYLKARSGLVLAGMEGIKYRKNEIKLMPGDKIYLYTDGVTEATDINNQLYGEKRLLSLVDNAGDVSPQTLCDLVIKGVDSFVGDAPQFDDITMLSVSLNGLVCENSVCVKVCESSRKTVNAFCDSLISKLEIVLKNANRIRIIFDEVFENILSYSKATVVDISYRVENKKLLLTFEDNGIKYNPTLSEAPDVTLSAEEREIGGLGIFMVKKMTENMEYSYENNKNILNLLISLE